MRRYDMNYFNKLPLLLGTKLIYKIIEDTKKKQAWEIWVSCYPHMEGKNFVPFEKFYNQQAIVKRPHKSAKELLNVADEIKTKIEFGEYKQVNFKE